MEPKHPEQEKAEVETGNPVSENPEATEPPEQPVPTVSNNPDITALAEALEGKKKDDDSDDDEAETVEESPCGRWLKRREEVKYRDVPGVDTAFLAMDSEEGVEVVWNEAQFSTFKKFQIQEDKLKNVFEALTTIDHPNIVHFHRYWTDAGVSNEKTGEKKLPRLIFITEYMSAGSLKQFLRRTKKNNRKIQLQSWKRWCTQILSALSYLHQTCTPPIIHGNLTCDTIFIQHNGLVKIGTIAPDIIHQNVKTCRENIRNLHYLAPEWGGEQNITPGPPSDVYAFGMCALETAALDIQTTAAPQDQSGTVSGGSQQQQSSQQGQSQQNQEEKPGVITEETIQRTIDQLEDDLQKDFIRKCLKKIPSERPSARELLFHPVLFEVHSLKLLAAHSLVNSPGVDTSNFNEMMTDEAIQSHYGPDTIMASVTKDGATSEYKLSNVPVAEKLEKFMEDVKFGIYPITAFALSQPPPPKTHTVSPESQTVSEKNTDGSPVPQDEAEGRRAVQVLASIIESEMRGIYNLIIIARLEDCINRQLTCRITTDDTPDILAEELIVNRFISPLDKPLIAGCLADVFRKLAVQTVKNLNDELDTDVPEIAPTSCLQDAEHHSNATTTIMRKRTLEEQADIKSKSIYSKLKFYNPGNKAVDSKLAAQMRDPTHVTAAFPLPEGAYFCPPAGEEGSVPFKIPPPGTNAFDCSHLEEKQKQDMISLQQSSGPSQENVNPASVASVHGHTAYTPKDPSILYDPYAYLQGAQKVLEGISAANQQALADGALGNVQQSQDQNVKKDDDPSHQE